MKTMRMIFRLFAFLLFANTLQAQDSECLKTIKESDFKISVCLKDYSWFVNSLQGDILIIGKHKSEMQISVSKRNKGTKTIKGAWRSAYRLMFRDESKYQTIEDSTFSNGVLTFYFTITESKKREKGKKIMYGSGIILRGTVYQTIECKFIATDENVLFFKEVMGSITNLD